MRGTERPFTRVMMVILFVPPERETFNQLDWMMIREYKAMDPFIPCHRFTTHATWTTTTLDNVLLGMNNEDIGFVRMGSGQDIRKVGLLGHIKGRPY